MMLIRRLLYQLKKEYGQVAKFYRLESNSVNTQTGEKAEVYRMYEIKKAIILPRSLYKVFLKENSQFKTVVDSNERQVIIDLRDLSNISFNLKDYITISHVRGEIVEISNWNEEKVVILRIKEIEGVLPFEIFAEVVEDDINVSDS